MTPKSNQEIEHDYFEQFRRIFPLPGQVKYGDKPDIIIYGKRKIGIEIRNYYLEEGNLIESEQKQRRMRENVLKEAQRLYSDLGGRYGVSFSFDKENPIKKSKILIPKIVKLINKLETSRTGGFPKPFLGDTPELDFVYIRPNPYSDPEWRITQLHNGQIMSSSRLSEIVRKKENKAMNYRNCDAYWLLVVIDFTDSAQDQEIQIDGVELRSDVYEKIIVYKTVSNQVLEF